MKLTDARAKFKALRADASKIFITSHAISGHPARAFTSTEILALVQGSGILRLNDVANPTPGSFLWHCSDNAGKACKIAVVFNRNAKGELIVVISAYR